jgi:hypothetical protein
MAADGSLQFLGASGSTVKDSSAGRRRRQEEEIAGFERRAFIFVPYLLTRVLNQLCYP